MAEPEPVIEKCVPTSNVSELTVIVEPPLFCTSITDAALDWPCVVFGKEMTLPFVGSVTSSGGFKPEPNIGTDNVGVAGSSLVIPVIVNGAVPVLKMVKFRVFEELVLIDPKSVEPPSEIIGAVALPLTAITRTGVSESLL